ncbi:hypothetical protein Ae406Ps2_1735c [Pseudonocardia sp. Ae406_Ps2]|uniref:YkvA family protein n=1 Tax=unclassified Pseudonocardia TaxID=2619320 RepID=UPI0002F304D9|nr:MULTISPECIES: YkvA family protein [unclassified Pseudonocardia]OLM01735.1 hypothetical protein Ae406Ps2_1735c [Pseudonocardia sp. Ae406_Ps2]OLM06482.1 hypothetical protein Ae331Ps2_4192 [Pseudonocardia sp. Ae331_Ps2]OLM13220.1 hypothetical protein Ae505Ps2_3348 [Pseudonocardia sp. Ae505_Ps2]OLM23305.1 hypothetical protein Ae706Ps2_1738c [Pseudonocardia sp. Ae706_Ps2]OLM32363.1 hypothetical protein Ae717Ps2_3258c [Pseudonocardia sp. Ae717_Ps2]
MTAASATAGRRAGRTAAFATLFRALTRRGRPGEPGPVERFRALPAMVGDAWRGTYPHLGRGRVALFLAALAYLVSPVDLVPEAFLTVFGLGDDAIVAMWLGGALLVEADRYLGWRRTAPAVVDGQVQVDRT